jgi:hypothetical protein
MNTPRHVESPRYPKVASPKAAAKPMTNIRVSHPRNMPCDGLGLPTPAMRLAYQSMMTAQAEKTIGLGTPRAKPSVAR